MTAPRQPKSHAAFSLAATSVPGGREYLPFLKRQLLASHAYLNAPLIDLSVAIVGAKQMGALHLKFMGDPTPTDVLTFDLDHNHAGKVTHGEVIVCMGVARAEARRRGIAVEHELLLYALHGMLHLCGFDDRTTATYRRMHRMEDRILTHLGIGTVFASRDSGSGSTRTPGVG